MPTPPETWYEPLIMPGIMTIFGVLICWLGWLSERNGKVSSWKWLGLVFLAAGMFFGFKWLSPMIGHSSLDSLYRSGLHTPRRYAYAHYVAFFMPLVALIGCVILQFVKPPSSTTTATVE